MIRSASYVISNPDVSSCPQSTLPEYAFIGRSNVGKSSLINMLCHNPKLAKTSQKPGKTLLINHFLIESTTANSQKPIANSQWHLVDLPGYGYAQAGQKQREALKKMIERYCLLREQLVCLFVLIDCRHEPQKIDLEFINWLGENGVPSLSSSPKATNSAECVSKRTSKPTKTACSKNGKNCRRSLSLLPKPVSAARN